MNFEQQMALGQQAQLHGDFQNALMLHQQASRLAQGRMEGGRAARGIGADSNRMGNAAEATFMIDKAFNLHFGAVEEGIPGALRERGASGMYVGRLALSSAVELELARKPKKEKADRSLLYLRNAVTDLETVEASQGGVYDQHGQDTWAWAAMVEGLYGKRVAAMQLGFRALRRAPLSQSPMVAQYNPDIPRIDRWWTRGVELKRASTALAVTALSFWPTRRTALKLAQKAL